MKSRVYYRVDGGVSIRKVDLTKKLSSETDVEYLDRTESVHENRQYDDTEASQIPVYDSATRSKWRGSKGQGVHIDNTVITIIEKRQIVRDDLDAELAKTNPNAIKAMRLQRKLDKREYD